MWLWLTGGDPLGEGRGRVSLLLTHPPMDLRLLVVLVIGEWTLGRRGNRRSKRWSIHGRGKMRRRGQERTWRWAQAVRMRKWCRER